MLIRQAHYLLAVADHGNFTRAAAALRISQPALSQRILDLEAQLGLQLFDRSGRTVKPTDEGRTYIEHVRRALREIQAGERAMQDIADALGGTLRVAFLPLFTTHLVGPLMQEFYKRYPRVSVTIDILAQAELEAALVEDRTDVGLAFSDVDSDEIDIERIQDDELCLVVGKRHPMYRKDKVRVSELKHADLALLTRAFITRAPIDRYFRVNNVRPRIAIEANSADTIIAIVRGAPIATIMPSATARQLPRLKAIPLTPSAGIWTLSVLQRKDAYRSAAAKALITILKQRRTDVRL
ncbi:MAG: transcriptional regulator CynR [Proteobacteria bacterium]|nr:transcriptional regulator CynR [Pseudomonadota bacterium]